MESSNNLNIIEKLVENIDYDILIEKCVNKKLIFDEMVDKLKVSKYFESERTRVTPLVTDEC